jgi:SOS-response transcriptional repressor LexA
MLAIMHNAPAAHKCLLHQPVDYLCIMSGMSDRLRQARERAGYPSAKAAAEAMNVPVATYIQHENGTRGFSPSRAERYGRFFRVTPEWLLYGKDKADTLVALGPRLYVIGEVAAGVFREAWKVPPDEWEAFTGRADVPAPVQKRFGLRVSGDSMNAIYPPGTILECIEYDGTEPIPNGKRVIVQRTKLDGSVEATVKELIRDEEGIEWLVPRSHNPVHQAFRGDQPGDPSITKIEIFGIVVASTRLE